VLGTFGQDEPTTVAPMPLPTRDEMLAKVDVRFRELAPAAPHHLDPDDPSHDAMIKQWHQAHHEVLSALTNEAYFSSLPNPPAPLDPANPEHAIFIEYWNDIADQINTGNPGRYDWSNAAAQPDASSDLEAEETEMPVQDGSVRFEERVASVHEHLRPYVDAVAATPLAAKLIEHTWQQVETLRGLVSDGTFQTYDHWWRSSSYSEAIYDEDDRNEQLAFVRDLTLEAKIDRTTGMLDLHLAGWATDFRTHNSWGRASMTDG
jgi:hypothetical protein